MKQDDIKFLEHSNGVHDVIVDLLNSLSTVKGLSELDCQIADEKALIAHALTILIQNQDMERCSFFLLQDNGCLVNVTGLSCEEYTESTSNEYQPLSFKVGEGIIGLAAKTRELQHCQDCRNDPRFEQHNQQSALLPGSIISVPVIVAETELVGVLNISHPEANYFNDWHIRLLHIYKNMLGQLITNCRLFQQMEQKIAHPTAKLQQALKDVKYLKERYESMSMIDDLTGLFNRRYFYAQAAMVISSLERYGQGMCVLILDLDYFKKINDSYGHMTGDQVLIDVAATLKEEMRESDILVRFGGEEFVVVFTNTDCRNGFIFAERIRKSINALSWDLDEEQVRITVSIGMTCLDSSDGSKPGIDIDHLIHCADVALYRSKAQGRNRSTIFTQEMLQSKR